MSDEPIATVKVKALQFHSYHGVEYLPGETYDIDAQDADSVEAQGKAVRAGGPRDPEPEPAA